MAGTAARIATLTFPNYMGHEISIKISDHVERHADGDGTHYLDWIVDLSQIEQAGPNFGSQLREVLPISSGVPIHPGQSVQITARPQGAAFHCGRFVISNAGTPGGAADWIVNDIRIGGRSQFVHDGDLPGDMFATNAIATYVSFETARTAMDVIVVVTYIGPIESGVPFFASMVGTELYSSPHYVRIDVWRMRTTIPFGFAYVSKHTDVDGSGITIYIPPIDQATIDVAVDATLVAGKLTPMVTTMIGNALDGRSGLVRDVYVALIAQLAGALSSAEAKAERY